MSVTFQKFSAQRNFGIEMEIGNEVALSTIATTISQSSSHPLRSNLYKNSINNNFWDLKLDGSCGKVTDCYGVNEGGYEVASFKASGIRQLNHIGKIAKKIKKVGAKTNLNCGLHVHVDVSDFSEEDMGRLLSAWLCIEKALLASTPVRRRYNKYCLPLKQFNTYKDCGEGKIDYLKVFECYRPNNTSPHNNTHRRRAVNILNWYRSKKVKNYKRSTIEFRFPEGTLVEANIKNWTTLLVNFVNHVKNSDYNYDFRKNCSLQEILFILGIGHLEKRFTLLSENLRETKIWFLRRLLRYSYDSYMDYSFYAEVMRESACQILKCMGEVCDLQGK